MNSTFITSFSLFESSFNRICKYAQKEKGIKLSLEDINGHGIIEKCKKYIEKVIETDLNSLNENWIKLKNYNKIRNLIVHNSANFKKDKSKPSEEQDLYPLLNTSPSIAFKNEKLGTFYIQDNKFIIEFCDIALKFLSDVITLIIEPIVKVIENK